MGGRWDFRVYNMAWRVYNLAHARGILLFLQVEKSLQLRNSLPLILFPLFEFLLYMMWSIYYTSIPCHTPPQKKKNKKKSFQTIFENIFQKQFQENIFYWFLKNADMVTTQLIPQKVFSISYSPAHKFLFSFVKKTKSVCSVRV